MKHEDSPAAVQKILRSRRARAAFDTLISEGVDKQGLEFWLSEIAQVRDKRSSKRQQVLQAQRRKVLALANKARALADEIERPRITTQVLTPDFLRLVTSFPRVLREFAKAWIDSYEPLFSPDDRVVKKTMASICLMELVRSATGRPHLPELTDLLNTADFIGNPQIANPRWNENQLKQLLRNYRKRMNILLRDLPKISE